MKQKLKALDAAMRSLEKSYGKGAQKHLPCALEKLRLRFPRRAVHLVDEDKLGEDVSGNQHHQEDPSDSQEDQAQS